MKIVVVVVVVVLVRPSTHRSCLKQQTIQRKNATCQLIFPKQTCDRLRRKQIWKDKGTTSAKDGHGRGNWER